MFKLAIEGFNCVIINNIKFLFIKIFHFKHFIYKISDLISTLTTVDIRDNGTIKFGEKVRITSGTLLRVRQNGKLIVGNKVYMNRNCHVVCYDEISIGDNTGFGPNVMIFDHDHIYPINESSSKKYKTSKIEIGKNVWIGAGTIILSGTKIGDNSVVGAGSVIKGNIPSSSVIIQKRKDTIIEIKEGAKSGE